MLLGSYHLYVYYNPWRYILKNKLFVMMATCLAFVGMTNAKLEAVSQLPPLLVVSCIRGDTNAVTLSTNTVSTFVDAAIGTSGGESQLIGLIEFNATKQTGTDLRLEIVQLVQIPATTPEGNNFPAFTSSNGDNDTAEVASSWTAIQIWSNVDPSSTSAFVYTNSTVLTRATYDSTNYGAIIASPGGQTFNSQIGILTFYAVDDANNSTAAGTYTAYFMLTFNTYTP